MQPVKSLCTLIVLAFVILIASACSGNSSPTAAVVSASASITNLERAGWQARSDAGMPNTVSGVRQTGYLVVVSPSHTTIDIQFFGSASDALSEIHAAQGRLNRFHGSTIANALVFAHPSGQTPISADLDQKLASLLR